VRKKKQELKKSEIIKANDLSCAEYITALFQVIKHGGERNKRRNFFVGFKKHDQVKIKSDMLVVCVHMVALNINLNKNIEINIASLKIRQKRDKDESVCCC
jgi:hypothetical protein